jgi:hypothetical protein
VEPSQHHDRESRHTVPAMFTAEERVWLWNVAW